MLCSNCQTRNPENARFCFNCGSELEIPCQNCGASLRPGARFCHNCGHPVISYSRQAGVTLQPEPSETPPARTPEDILQRFIPKELLAKLEAARVSGLVAGERRVVTTLFCDIKGSTSAAAGLDPEEWAEIVNGAFECMIRPVYKYEGTVARLMGDGLLAFFGAPIAHEDDPQRAVLAGLEIAEAVHAYGESIRSRWNSNLEVRVGINTGLVVVGTVGSDLRVEYTALGDAINLAARMEQTASPGTVQIAEPTYRLVAPLFDFEPIEELAVKGRELPIRAYRVLGLKAVPGSLRGISGLKAPLIGRAEAIALLQRAVTELKGGAGRIVSLIGEAGLGKSRLIQELQALINQESSQPILWIEGQTRSYEHATPFALFIDLFKRLFDLQPDQSDETRMNTIRDYLDQVFDENDADLAPFIASMLGLPLDPESSERVKYLNPPQLRGRIFQSGRQVLEGLLKRHLVVLSVDDLHWADPTSLELLQSLLPLTDAYPLMILAAYRPQREELSWKFHEVAQREYHHRYTLIELEPLDLEQSRQLIAGLLEIEDLPGKVRQLIQDKAEGNPFFVEEIIRSLLDEGLVFRDDGHWRARAEIHSITIPNTLTGVITARLDRLAESPRRVLQAASVLGREFSAEVLADMLTDDDSPLQVLPELQRRDLIQQKSHFPHANFLFKHALTQEAAYNSLLLSHRREFHLRAAEAIITHHPEQVSEIAQHLIEARQFSRALPYLIEAGHLAMRAYATSEASQFFQKALDLQDSTDDLGLIRTAYEGLGSVLTFTHEITEAKQVYEKMLKLADAHQDIPMQISALNKLGALHALSMGQFREGEVYLDRAEELTRRYEEKSSIPEAALIRCQICTAKADFEHVVIYMGEVVEVAEELGHAEDVLLGLEHVATSLAFMTHFEEAREKAGQALRLARELGNREREATLLTSTLPMIYTRDGDFETAQASLREGLEIARRIGAIAPQVDGGWFLAEIARQQGEYEQALEYGHLALSAALPMEEFMPFVVVLPLSTLGSIYLEISPQFRDKISEFHHHALRLLETPAGAMTGGVAWADVGFCALTLGDIQLAEVSLQKGLNTPTMFSLIERARLLAGSALLARSRGELDQARLSIEEAIAYAQERGMRNLTPLLSFVDGNIHLAAGELEKALQAFEVAESKATDFTMRPLVWQARAVATETLAKMGRREEAENMLAGARAMTKEIARLFQDRTLRETFEQNIATRLPDLSPSP